MGRASRAEWEIANSRYRKEFRSWQGHAHCSEGASLATPGNDPPCSEESSPRASTAEILTSRFLNGCEKTNVHMWIDQACNAKIFVCAKQPSLHRLVKTSRGFAVSTRNGQF